MILMAHVACCLDGDSSLPRELSSEQLFKKKLREKVSVVDQERECDVSSGREKQEQWVSAVPQSC